MLVGRSVDLSKMQETMSPVSDGMPYGLLRMPRKQNALSTDIVRSDLTKKNRWQVWLT